MRNVLRAPTVDEAPEEEVRPLVLEVGGSVPVVGVRRRTNET